jgi:dihydrofolate reductase
MNTTKRHQKVFFSNGISLEGFSAGPNASPTNAMGDGAVAMHEWIFATRSWQERAGMEGGTTGTSDDRIVQDEFERIGAWIIGENMFKEGEVNWPEEAPFRVPVYVLTHTARQPWERLGGTTFYFITDGIESALEKARVAAGDKDVRIGGGANTIQQYLNAGHIDEFRIDYSTIVLGKGLPLFANLRTGLEIRIKEVIPSERVTHILYEVLKP